MLYTAFLRGINVGGHRKIKMAELKKLLEDQGCKRVRTYIQSGNIIFEQGEEAVTREKLEALILEQFSMDVPAVLMTAEGLKKILQDFPFKDDHPDKDGNRTVFTFLVPRSESNNSTVTEEEINKLKEFVRDSEKLVYSSQGFWLYCPEGFGKTKLSSSLVEKKTGKTATTRNLRTVKAMVLLTEETEKDG